jgi:hypothetical protein
MILLPLLASLRNPWATLLLGGLCIGAWIGILLFLRGAKTTGSWM